MTIEYKGYTAQQARNHHITILDQDGKIVSHIYCAQPLTEDELRDRIDEFLEIMDEFRNE